MTKKDADFLIFFNQNIEKPALIINIILLTVKRISMFSETPAAIKNTRQHKNDRNDK